MSTVPVNPELVRDIVLRECGLTIADIHGTNKAGRISFARAVIAFVLRKHTNMTLPEISKVIKGSNRSGAQATDGVGRIESGRYDELAMQITSSPVTGSEYARYVWIRADEATKGAAGKRFGREVA